MSPAAGRHADGAAQAAAPRQLGEAMDRGSWLGAWRAWVWRVDRILRVERSDPSRGECAVCGWNNRRRRAWPAGRRARLPSAVTLTTSSRPGGSAPGRHLAAWCGVPQGVSDMVPGCYAGSRSATQRGARPRHPKEAAGAGCVCVGGCGWQRPGPAQRGWGRRGWGPSNEGLGRRGGGVVGSNQTRA